jgi:4'-phosphopantetheinyl transferase
MPVPPSIRKLEGTEMVKALRSAAEKALAHSATYSEVALGSLTRKENGAPVPCNGIFWSLSHTPDYVAAVNAPYPVGIDIEKIAPVSDSLMQQIAGEGEWALAPEMTTALFYRYWTAKEAALKAVGIGLAGLSKCRVKELIDGNQLILQYGSEQWQVSSLFEIDGFITSVTARSYDLSWHLL